MQEDPLPICARCKAGSNVAAKMAITTIISNTSISVSPLIFALVESVFMALEL
jgi:hypothetical protein